MGKILNGISALFMHIKDPSRPLNLDTELATRKGDQPELINDLKKYQFLIGSVQWAVLLWIWDVATAVMMISAFRTEPKQGHLDCVKRIVAYNSKMRHTLIRFHTKLLHYLGMPDYGWEKSVYGIVKEEIPKDCPEPLVKEVVLTSFVDENL